MIVRITNTPRPYAWGSTSAISDLLGLASSGAPEAELWLGSHPASPARIVSGAAEADLAQWASAHVPGGRLPFLLKVLAAAAPLSLQAHPTAEQAREGFARENLAGIPLGAPERNYRDDAHKPELILALSDPFRALCGFRPIEESRADLRSLDDERLAPLIDRLVNDASLSIALEWLLRGGSDVDAVVAALVEHASAASGDESGVWLGTVRMLAEHYPGDPGIALSTLLHTVLLRPGEALYLPARNIHAYLEGLGIEIMAASDNVLRCGFTSKHIDVAELMRIADPRPMPPPYLEPERPAVGVAVYRPDVVDFRLVTLDESALAAGVEVDVECVAIVLCLEGELELEGEGSIARGEAALVVGSLLRARGSGRAVVATGRHPEVD